MVNLDMLIPIIQIFTVIAQAVLVGCAWSAADDSLPVEYITLLLTATCLSIITTILFSMLLCPKSLEPTAHMTIALSTAVMMFVASILASCSLIIDGVDQEYRSVAVAFSSMCYFCTVLDVFKFVLNKARYFENAINYL